MSKRTINKLVQYKKIPERLIDRITQTLAVVLKKLRVATLVLIWSASALAQEQPAESRQALLSQVQLMLSTNESPDINAGIYVKNLSTGETFTYHAQRMFAPASVTKLFTAYAALTYLGSNYKFATFISANRKTIHHGRLDGNLAIKFSGDPSFTYDDLKSLFASLNVQSIGGNIIIDGTIFDENHSPPGGYTWDDSPFYYAAPKSAIIVNKNCSKALMGPARNDGYKALLKIDDPSILGIENNVQTVAPRRRECPYKSRYIGDNKYEVYGCMFQNVEHPISLNFALQDNQLMIRQYITKALDELKIKFAGKFVFGKQPASTDTVLTKHESAPLTELLTEILAHSCNIYSGALLKHMTAKHTGLTADHESAEQMLKSRLKAVGIDGQFVIKDGAGESRYNLITPAALVKLLETIYSSDQTIRDAMLNSMAQHGSKGTLKTRSIGPVYDKDIYAKTGFDSTASTLAGYYLPSTGDQYVFAIMIGNHNMSWTRVKQLEDRILATVLDGMGGDGR